MKRLVLATMALAALAVGAARADGYGGSAPLVRQAPCANFNGFYLGGNVGGSYHHADRNDDDGYFVDNSGHSTVGTSFNGGVQGGYNHQYNCSLIGLEADWNWASSTATFNDIPNVPGVDFRINSDLNWFGTLRARAGIVADNLLLYATAGVAWAQVDNTYIQVFPGFVNETNTADTTRWGFVVGGGAEFLLGHRWTLKGEALYLQFDQNYDSFRSLSQARVVRFTNEDSVLEARLGVNYLFGY